jgi:hypothetical protein
MYSTAFPSIPPRLRYAFAQHVCMSFILVCYSDMGSSRNDSSLRGMDVGREMRAKKTRGSDDGDAPPTIPVPKQI